MDQRAITDEEKRDVTDGLLLEWRRRPHQRLGQLICNALREHIGNDWEKLDSVLFSIEDYELLRAIKMRVRGDG